MTKSDMDFINGKYISNCKALKFLKGLQGEQDNELRIQFLCNFLYGSFRFDDITLMYKLNNIEDSVSMFIINNYLLKIGSDNPEEKPWGETLKSLNLNNIIVYDGVEYYCMLHEERATLYPTCKVDKSEIVIPAKVSLNGNTYKVEGLGVFAFYEANFEKVEFEDEIEQLTLNNEAFSFCKNLKIVKFPKCLRNLILRANFMECPKLDTVIFPEYVLESLDLGNHTFRNCFNFRRINLPKSVDQLNIGCNCLSGCPVYSMKIPLSLKKLHIDDYAFSSMKCLHIFKLNDGLEELCIGELAFYNTSLLCFDIPSSIISLKIERAAFYACTNLVRLTIPRVKEKSEVSYDVKDLSERLRCKFPL